MITKKQILREVADHYDIGVSRLTNRSKKSTLDIEAKRVCILALRRFLNLSYSEIGRTLDRHHTTILNSCKTISKEYEKNEKFKKKVDFLFEYLDKKYEMYGVSDCFHRRYESFEFDNALRDCLLMIKSAQDRNIAQIDMRINLLGDGK